MQNTILKFLYGAIAVVTVSTTGMAVTKISADYQTAKAKTTTTDENQTISNFSEKTNLNEKSENINQLSQKSTQTSSQNEPEFTLAELATHDTADSCYIAHNGTVYDVTNVASWTGCNHHGATGGIDITAIFPHPISYLNPLNKVGVLVASTGQINKNNQNNSNPIKSKNDDNEHENYESDD